MVYVHLTDEHNAEAVRKLRIPGLREGENKVVVFRE